MGSDPYWPHQALAGRCTPRSGQRSRIAAGRHPRSAACRAFPQTASCLLNRKRARGRKVGGWKTGENRQMLADGTVLLREYPPPPTTTTLPTCIFCDGPTAVVVIVVCRLSVHHLSLLHQHLIEIEVCSDFQVKVERDGVFCTCRQTV